MRHKSLILMTIFFLSTAVLAAKPPHHGFTPNEDMKFIRDTIRNEKAAELAEVLALSSDQVTRLREARAAADMIEAEHDPVVDAAVENLHAAAASIRASIEAGNPLSQEQRDQLKTLKQTVREAHSAKREDLRTTFSGLRDLLTDEQRTELRDFAIANRPQRPPFAGDEAAAPGRRGERLGRGGNRRGPGGEREPGSRMRGKMMKVFLSDAFLSQYP